MRHFSCLMIVGLLPVWAPIGLARAQEAVAEKVMKIIREHSPKLQTRLFGLNHVDLGDFVNTVKVVYNVRNVSAVERTNSVVVRSTPATLDEIAVLLDQMEQQADAGGGGGLAQVYRLKERDPDRIADLLSDMFVHTRIMPDYDSRQIVLKGDDAAEIEEILRMLKALDVQANYRSKRESTKTLSVTVDFIRASVGAKGEGSLPENLQGVGAALRKSGLGDLQIYGHFMVRTQEGQEFESNGVVRSGESDSPPSFLRVQGTAELVDGRAQLQIKSVLDVPIARAKTDNAGNSITQIRYEDIGLATTTTVPLGDYLVLGAIPARTGESDSILMVINITTD